MVTAQCRMNAKTGRSDPLFRGSFDPPSSSRRAFQGISVLAMLLVLVSCVTPSWHIEDFGTLDLEGFGVLESELSFFADRQADPVFFDGFLAAAGPGAGLPEAFSSPMVKDRIRQILIFRPAGKPFVMGLISIDAPRDLLTEALKSGGFRVEKPQVPGSPGTGIQAGAGSWYSRDGNLLLSLPVEGLVAFQLQTFTGLPVPGTPPAEGDLTDPVLPGAPGLSALENFASFAGRIDSWKTRSGSLVLTPSGHALPGRLLKVDIDLRSSGAVGRVLGALVLRSLSLDFRSSADEGRVEAAFSLRTPAGTGTTLVRKAVRLMLLGISNRLGLDAGFLEAIHMEGNQDTLEITGLSMSRTQGIDFIALLMGSSGS